MGSAQQREQYRALQVALATDPEQTVSPHAKESRQRRLLRHLRAWDFDVTAAKKSVHAHSAAWQKYDMDSFTGQDEMNETETFFCCGKDLWGRPTLIARPAVWFAGDSLE